MDKADEVFVCEQGCLLNWFCYTNSVCKNEKNFSKHLWKNSEVYIKHYTQLMQVKGNSAKYKGSVFSLQNLKKAETSLPLFWHLKIWIILLLLTGIKREELKWFNVGRFLSFNVINVKTEYQNSSHVTFFMVKQGWLQVARTHLYIYKL